MRTGTDQHPTIASSGLDTPQPRPARRYAPPAWSVPVVAYVASRASVVLAFVAATWIAPQLRFASVFGGGWDAGWYLRIAQSGYPSNLRPEGGGNRWAFFPALPALIRGVHDVTTLPYVDAAVVVALLAGLAGTLAVWLAVCNRFGDEVASRTVLVLVFFPIAFVLSMAYAEGLFLAMAGLCLLCLDRSHWYWAAVFAAAGSLTRFVGIVLIVCVGVAALLSMRQRRSAKPLFAAVLSAVPIAAWLGYAHHRTGEFLAFLKAEQSWAGAHFVWFTTPFHSIAHLLTSTQAWRVAPDVLAGLGLVFVAVGVVLLILPRRLPVSLPASWWTFTVGGVAVALSGYWATSILRFCFVVFPLFVGIAARRFRYFEAVVGGFAILQGALAVVAFSTIVTWQHAPFAP